LQDEAVQLSLFGRRLAGEPDTLLGYRQTRLEIQEPGELGALGAGYLLNVQFTGDPSDSVVGTLFKVSRKELEHADTYELADNYKRVGVQLKSGTRAWVYLCVAVDHYDQNQSPDA
jgi:gamma-glutamylcyclotransferase (GGCT)/AIG2-like uncharacterized protein YtfP